jgi:predicted dehydrogenase
MNAPAQSTAKKPLALGFIGGSLRSAVGYAHSVACKMDGRWDIAAGCFSTDEAMNRETAQAYGVAEARTYQDWCSMLAQEKQQLDAALVLSPTPLHGNMVIGCLEAGIPVICEKSLAVSSAEVSRIMAARDASKGFLAVTYNYSGYPMVRELRKIIASGRLGKILHFQAEMPQEGFIRVDSQGNKPKPQWWRLSDGDVPTIHLDLGVHLHQLIYYLIRQHPLAVVADQSSNGWFSGIVDNVMCIGRYSGNVQGQFWFSKSALGHRNGLRLRIYGSEGSAEWFQANPEELTLSFANGKREMLDRAAIVDVANQARYTRFKAGHPAGFVEAFANLYADIADCLSSYKQTGHWHSDDVFGPELALEGLQFLEAMTLSAKTGKWCDIAGTKRNQGA